jgi:carotenoid cleavage dioxygenase-like enzyme
MTVVQTNKWLTGRYAPLGSEVAAFDLPVSGQLPEELSGRYLRNGPNPMGEPDPATYHWFTGDGMVHGILLREGRAEWYRARWVRSSAVSEALGEDPAPGERHGGADTANTNVIGLGGRTFALVEAGARPVELDFELGTVEHSDLGGTLPNGFTAHPKVDPATGDLHAIAYHWTLPHLQYLVVAPDATVRRVEPIEIDHGPMVHDCSITERWMVVYDFPVDFDLELAMSGARLPYVWNDRRAARIGLLPLGGSGADVRWFEVPPCYSFHPLNAHDDGDRVVIDLVRYSKMFDVLRLGPDESPPMLWRYTIDTASGTVTEEQRSDVPMEFPRVDERRVGRPHRRGYAMEVDRSEGGNDLGGRLLLIDAPSGEVTPVDLGPGRTGAEWVMVPRDAGAAEDDGWLMGLVHDASTGRGELVVLDAASPADGPLARVHLPDRVPAGFHGNWVPDEV